MGCGCSNNRDIRNWNSLLQSFPVDPLSVISYAELSVAGPSQVGQWALSSTYREPTVPSTWLPTPVSVNGEVTVISNGADIRCSSSLMHRAGISEIRPAISQQQHRHHCATRFLYEQV
ncbi:MAG: hypothetical protein OKBPIBMD_01959 [Chlorobi bacterium]|nr:hypothetical protein [Chlorobiota bacterium]